MQDMHAKPFHLHGLCKKSEPSYCFTEEKSVGTFPKDGSGFIESFWPRKQLHKGSHTSLKTTYQLKDFKGKT